MDRGRATERLGDGERSSWYNVTCRDFLHAILHKYEERAFQKRKNNATEIFPNSVLGESLPSFSGTFAVRHLGGGPV